MTPTVAPVAICALVIGAAGIAKLARPAGTAQALREARLPGLARAGQPVAQAVGVAEIVLAVSAFVWGNRLTTAGIVAAQLLFAAFALRLLARRGGAASCGCFGASQAPVHGVHVALNLALAAVAAVGLARPPGAFGAAVTQRPLDGITLVACTLLGAWAVVLAFTALPELLVQTAQGRADAEAA